MLPKLYRYAPSLILAAFCCATSVVYAVPVTVVGPASTTLTYAPSISAGINTNITTYSSSFKWIYALYPFTVTQTGTYTASSTTTDVVNTTFFLTGTFTPSSTFPPSTPISNFFISDFSGGLTASFPTLNLTAGTQYSVLVAFNQTTPGSYPYQVTLNFDGPGCVSIGNNTCAVATGAPISPWVIILMALLLAATGLVALRLRPGAPKIEG